MGPRLVCCVKLPLRLGIFENVLNISDEFPRVLLSGGFDAHVFLMFLHHPPQALSLLPL